MLKRILNFLKGINSQKVKPKQDTMYWDSIVRDIKQLYAQNTYNDLNVSYKIIKDSPSYKEAEFQVYSHSKQKGLKFMIGMDNYNYRPDINFSNELYVKYSFWVNMRTYNIRSLDFIISNEFKI